MLNFLRADLWKVFRGKSFYVITIALIIVMFVVGYVFEMTTRVPYGEYKIAQEKWIEIKIEEGAKVQSEEEYNLEQIAQRESMNAKFYLAIIPSQPGLFYLAFVLFMTLFILQYYKRGYLKNILNIPQAKGKWIASKFMVSAITASLYTALIILAACGLGLWKTGVIGVSFKEMATFFLAQLGTLMGLSAIQIFLVLLFQQSLPAVLIGIALAMNMQAIVLGLFDNLRLLDINLASSTLMARIFNFTSVQGKNLNSILLMAGAYIILSSVLSWLTFKKSDITC